MRWQGRRESDNVEDRRNSSGGPSMGGPGFRLPSGKGGLILLIVVLVAGYYGVDLTGLMTGQPVSQQQSTRSISPNEDEAAKFTSVILATTEDTWGQQFEKMVNLSATKWSCTWNTKLRRAVHNGAINPADGQFYRSLLL
ncbi:MAG: neutral zinc metallopeptidase [Escherichia sp.]